MRHFWKFRNVADKDPELMLYGEIADQDCWWDDNATSPVQFKQDLEALGAPNNINVRINSVGGDVFAAHAIYNILKSNPANIIAVVDGLCASAATIVAMAADKIVMPSNSVMMVHKPSAMLFGSYNSDDMDKMSETLDIVQNSIVAAYVAKTGRDPKDLAALMDQEKWMTAQEAKDEGFCDDVIYSDQNSVNKVIPMSNNGRYLIVNSVAHDMSHFDLSDVKKAMQKARNNMLSNNASIEIPLEDTNNFTKDTVKDKKEDTKLEIKTTDELITAFPDLISQIVNQAIAEERGRLQDIDKIAKNLDQTLVQNAKYGEKPMSAKDLAFQALQADNARNEQFLKDREKELKDAETNKVDGHTDTQPQDTAIVVKIAAAANQRLHKGGTK